MQTRPPIPPFDFASASQKVRLAEDGWNSRNANAVSKAYSVNTQ
jgi:nuclear transport factor 2 (NTF2) superfamily protein